MGSNPPNCSGKRASWYSIFDIADSRSIGCRLGDLTDSRRVESKSSYSANRHHEIEIFGKRVSTGSRYCSEIAYYLEKMENFDCCVKKHQKPTINKFLLSHTFTSHNPVLPVTLTAPQPLNFLWGLHEWGRPVIVWLINLIATAPAFAGDSHLIAIKIELFKKRQKPAINSDSVTPPLMAHNSKL